MKWIEIDKNNLPEGEVLVALIEKGEILQILLGRIWISKLVDCPVCGFSSRVTHYIDPKNIEMP